MHTYIHTHIVHYIYNIKIGKTLLTEVIVIDNAWKYRRDSGVLVYICFLLWVLFTWVCFICEHLRAVKLCVLFLYIMLQ